MYINLGLNTSDFESRLRKAMGDLDVFTSKGRKVSLKADLDFADSKQLQQQLDKAWRGLKGITLNGKVGQQVPIENFRQVVREYKRMESAQAKNIQLTKEQETAYQKLRAVITATMNLGNAKYASDNLAARMQRAANTGMVNRTRNAASKDPNAEQDRLYRKRYAAFVAEDAKEKREEQRQQQQQVKADDARLAAAQKLDRAEKAYKKAQAVGSKALTALGRYDNVKAIEEEKKALNELIRLKVRHLQLTQCKKAVYNDSTLSSIFARKEVLDQAKEDVLQRQASEREAEQQRRKEQARNARAQVARKSYDKEVNRIVNGGNTNNELANMRQYYTEQAKEAKLQLQQHKRDLQQYRREHAKEARAQAKADQQAAQQQAANDKLTESTQRLARAEKAYQTAQGRNKNGKNIQRINDEIAALRTLIKAKEENLRLQTGRRGQTDSQLDGYRAQLNQLEQQRRKVQDTNQQFSQQGNIISRLGNALSTYFNLYSVIRFGKKIAETTGYFEQQRVALEGITGSAAEANKLLREISDFALKSPFQTKELVNFTKQLAAFSIPTDELFETTTRLADLSAGLGVDMSRIVLAYGQVRSASVLRGQELRQFTEAGIPMVDALAKKFTELNGTLVTTGEIFDLISKRQVSFDMVDSVLRDMTSEGGKFYKMQENISETLYGQMQKLTDMWTVALNEIGKGANGVLMAIVKALQWVAKNAKSVGAALVVAFGTNVIAKTITGFYKLVKSIQVATLTLKTFAMSMGGVASAALGVITFAISSIISKTNRLKEQLNDITKSYQRENAKMIGGLNDLLAKLRTTTVGTREFKEVLDTLSSNYSEFINVNGKAMQSLIAEQQAGKDVTDQYLAMSAAIEEAIKSKNRYNEWEEKEEKVKENFIDYIDYRKLWGDNNRYDQFVREISVNAYRNSKQNNRYASVGLYTHSGEEMEKAIKNTPTVTLLQEDYGKQYKDSDVGVLNAMLKETFDEIFERFADSNLSVEDMRNITTGVFGEKFTGHEIPQETIGYIADVLYNKALNNKYYEELKNIQEERAVSENAGLNGIRRTLLNSLEIDKGGLLSSNNPLERMKAENKKYIEGLNSDDVKKALDDITTTYNDGLEGNVMKAKAALQQALNGSDDDENKIRNVSVAMTELQQALAGLANGAGADAAGVIYNWIEAFQKVTRTLTKQEAEIANNIENTFGNRGVKTFGDKTFDPATEANKWNPALNRDKTIEQQREALAEEISAEQRQLKTYRKKDAKLYANEIKVREERLKLLKELAGADFYNVNLDSDKGGRSSQVQVPLELQEFITSLKDAYTTYKTAAQSQGGNMGVAYMQNDPKMIEKFNDFFHGATDEKSFNGLKLNGKRIGDLLHDAYFDSGMEEGVADFGKAIGIVVEQLKEVGNQGKAYKQFLNAAKELSKWWDGISSKDNVQGWITDMNKALSDMRKEFARTTEQVDFYRKLIENGTVDKLGGFTGTTKQQALSLDSVLQLGNINQLIATYNDMLQQLRKEDNEQRKENSDHYLNLDTTNLTSLPAIQAAIQQVSEQKKLNDDNFTTSPLLGEMGKQLEEMLNAYKQAIINEISSVSGEIHTGNKLNDTIANAKNTSQTARTNYQRQENVAFAYGIFDEGALKAYMDTLKTNADDIFEQFLKSNDFAALSNAGRYFGGKGINFDEMRAKLQKVVEQLPDDLARELKKKFDELEQKVDEFNAKGAMIGSLTKSMRKYRNAHETATQRYNDKKNQVDNLEVDLAEQENQKSYIENEIRQGTEKGMNTEQLDLFKSQLVTINDDIVKTRTELASCNAELEEMGENGSKLEQELRINALENIKSDFEDAGKVANDFSSVVTGTINVFKSMSKAVNKVYDVMNDGENPEWMRDMDDFLGDFGEAFEELVAPIVAVIGVVIALTTAILVLGDVATPILIVMAALIAVAVIIAAVVAAVQQHDRALEHDIEDLEKRIEEFDTAITNLNAAAERQVGLEKLGTNINAVGKELSKASAYAKQAELEDAKKNTDEDKLKEYRQKQQEAMDAFLNGMKEITDELTASTEDWADAMSSAIRSAFQNGENAARAFRGTVKEMMGDIIENMLRLQILEPLVQAALKDFIGVDVNDKKYQTTDKDGVVTSDHNAIMKDLVENITDPEQYKEFEKKMNEIGNGFIDVIDSMPPYLKELYSFKADNASLSGGIESITEDTARRLEALSNSQLGELVLIRNLIQNYFSASSGYSNSTMATIQSAITLMNSNVAIIANMTSRLEKHIADLRTSPVQPLHVTMV